MDPHQENALLKRISAQDFALEKQQKSLDAIMCSVAEMRAEFTRAQESILSLGGKTDKTSRVIADSMTRLATVTLKALGENESKSRERWGRVEKSLEELKEEIRDPLADCDPIVHHEVGVGSSSPPRKPVYKDAGTALTPARFLAKYMSRNDVSGEIYDGSLVSADWDTQSTYDEDKISNQTSSNNASLFSTDVDHSSFETTAEDIEQGPTESMPETVSPRDTLCNPTHRAISPPTLSSTHFHDSGMQVDLGTQEHGSVDPGPSHPCAPSVQLSKVSLHITQPIYSATHSTASPEQVANSLFPGPEDMENEHSDASGPISICTSTTTLPEPSSLLSPSRNKVRNEQPERPLPSVPPILAERQRSNSLSSLTSLSSIDDAPMPEPILPGGTAEIKSEVALRNKVEGSLTGARKRRRSSPGPARGTGAKKARPRTQTGTTKKVKQELINNNGALKGKKNMKNSGSWPKKRSTKDGGNKQFIQCDRCELWYHWACVGIRKNDLRLDDDKDFVCPPCVTNLVERVPRRDGDQRGETCSRPDCDVDDDAVEEEFFIERIIGRVNHNKAGAAWLIKWEGYPAEQATWTPGSEFGNSKKLIEDFKSAAEVNGMQVPGKNLTLLPEAVGAGWTHKKD